MTCNTIRVCTVRNRKALLPDSPTEDAGACTREPRDRSALGEDIAGALDREVSLF